MSNFFPSLTTFFLVCSVILSPSSVKAAKLSLQELQSPAGPKHSDAILTIPLKVATEEAMGLIYFANNLVVPKTGGFNSTKAMGTQTGHCVEVWKGKELACYFRFKVTGNSNIKGVFTAEALFSLTDFPNADLVITGGTAGFVGIVGSGKTKKPVEGFDGTSFIYDFDFTLPAKRSWW